MFTSQAPVTEAEKREALDEVLRSTTLARSAQLRAFLRHVCEMEIAGRSQELTEYQIAVDVLGRRKDATFSDDSSVRNRAYELRQRLEKYYGSENSHARVRIEIPRGGYVPNYIRQPETVLLDHPVEIPALPDVQPAKAKRKRTGVWLIAGIALACLALGWAAGSMMSRKRPPAVVAEAWGPLAEPRQDLLIVVATNLYMQVRPHIPQRRWRYPVPTELYPMYSSTRPLEEGSILYMEPALLSVPLAELTAAASLANMRTAFGGAYQILPEAEAPVAALRGRNAILLGTSVNSLAAALLLKNAPLAIQFNQNDEFAIVDQRKPPGQNEIFVAQPRGDPAPSVLYGTLTVFTGSDTAGNPRRTVVVSGTGSAAVQAAVEFFCSADRMRELKDRFRAAGLAGFPPGYQVVVRAKTSGLRLISYEYVTHIVMDK